MCAYSTVHVLIAPPYTATTAVALAAIFADRKSVSRTFVGMANSYLEFHFLRLDQDPNVTTASLSHKSLLHHHEIMPLNGRATLAFPSYPLLRLSRTRLHKLLRCQLVVPQQGSSTGASQPDQSRFAFASKRDPGKS